MESFLRLTASNAIAATLLAIGVLLITRIYKRPAFTHALWLIVLLKLVTPPIFQIPVPNFAPVEAATVEAPELLFTDSPTPTDDPVTDHALAEVEEFDIPNVALDSIVPNDHATEIVAAVQPATVAAPSPQFEIPWLELIRWAWGLGTAGYLALVGLRVFRFTRLLRYMEAAPVDVIVQVERMARSLGLTNTPRVCMVPGPVSPMLWAIVGRPRILLPSVLWQRLGPEQRDTLLAHELAHLRRRDHWTRRLELVVTALYWWNPVVWLARRQLAHSEEECCDAWVVWLLPETAQQYALALLETVEFLSDARSALPPAASGIGHVHQLQRRLSMIVHKSVQRSLTRGGLAAAFVIGCLALPLAPTLAQSPKKQAAQEAEAKSAADTELRLAERLYQESAEQKADASNGFSGDEAEDAKDLATIMHAQIESKKAEMAELMVRVKSAADRFAAQEKLHKAGGASKEDFRRAEEDLEVLKAQVAQKEAQIKEAMIRAEVAARRAQRTEERSRENQKRAAEKTDKGSPASKEQAMSAKLRLKFLEEMSNQASRASEGPFANPDLKLLVERYEAEIKSLKERLAATDNVQRVHAEAALKQLRDAQQQSHAERDQAAALRAALENERRAHMHARELAEQARSEAEMRYKKAKLSEAKSDEKARDASNDDSRMKAMESKLEALAKDMASLRKELKNLSQRDNEKK